MTKRLAVSIAVIITFLNSIVVFAESFTYSAVIQPGGEHKYKAVRLTPEVYGKLRSNLADIEIINNNGEAVPFFINGFTENEEETKKSYEMKLVNSFVKDNDYYYDYALKNLQSGDVTATSIELQTSEKAFAKKTEVYGSYDNVNWEKVQDDILYKVDENKKLEITFDNVKKYTYYRLKLTNNLEKVSFSSVELKFSKLSQRRDYFIEKLNLMYSVSEQGNYTTVKLESLMNLKLKSITLKTDSLFKRTVVFNKSTAKVLYNLDFSNTSYKDLTIPLEYQRINTDTAELVIENQDDKPINIKAIEVEYMTDELVFDGSVAGPYTLKFGNSNIITPKQYDIRNYRELVLKDGYDLLKLNSLVKTGQAWEEAHKQPINYKLLFNIVISVAAVVMGLIILMKLKKS